MHARYEQTVSALLLRVSELERIDAAAWLDAEAETVYSDPSTSELTATGADVAAHHEAEEEEALSLSLPPPPSPPTVTDKMGASVAPVESKRERAREAAGSLCATRHDESLQSQERSLDRQERSFASPDTAPAIEFTTVQLQSTATPAPHCNTLDTATHCNTMQSYAIPIPHCNTLDTATHCNTLDTATHCNTNKSASIPAPCPAVRGTVRWDELLEHTTELHAELVDRLTRRV